MYQLQLVSVLVALVAAPLDQDGRTEEIDRICSFVHPGSPGVSVGVALEGEVVASRVHGLADLEAERPITEKTVFDIGSTHKQFVAASVLLLVSDEELALDDDVREYLPELPELGHVVTIDHLLTHTSGIRDWTGILPLAPEGTEVLDLILRQRELNFAPGDEWSYSNSGYVLLKEIVARVSGGSFAVFVEKRMFEPLGMDDSAYVADVMVASGDRALAYRRDGAEWAPHMRLAEKRGGGCIVSNARDLLTWNAALTNERFGPFVSKKLEERTVLNNGRVLDYGRGLIVQDTSDERIVWHSGGAAGYGTWLGRFTKSGLSIAVLCNAEEVSASDVARRVSDLFLPPRQENDQDDSAPDVDVSGRGGLYLDTATGEPLHLVARGGRLAVPGAGPLVSVDERRFRPAEASLFFRSGDEFELEFRDADELTITSMEGEVTTYRRADPRQPSPEQLELFDGRYRSVELGSVFEVVSGPESLTFRLEDDPENSLATRAVARDTFAYRRIQFRFVRDAAGAVVGLEYRNPVVRRVRFERVGDRENR